MTEFITSIYQKNPTADFDFLLCPVHHQYTLRQQLIKFNFSLKTECLIIENQRFYEILLVSKSISDSKVSAVGSLIWQGDTQEQLKVAADYLHNILAHYKRMQTSRHSDVQHIISAYSAVII